MPSLVHSRQTGTKYTTKQYNIDHLQSYHHSLHGTTYIITTSLKTELKLSAYLRHLPVTQESMRRWNFMYSIDMSYVQGIRHSRKASKSGN